MFNKLTPVLRNVPRIMSINARCMGSGPVPAHFKTLHQICIENKSHMDFLPVPEGSWQEQWEEKNKRYNLYLACSSASLIVSFAIVYSFGYMFLGGAPPAYMNNDYDLFKNGYEYEKIVDPEE